MADHQGGGWRLNGHKKWIGAVSVVAMVLAAAVSWQQLDLPALAFDHDVEKLDKKYEQRLSDLQDRQIAELRAQQTEIKSRLLNDIKLRLSRELNSIEEKIWQRRQSDETVPEWMTRKKSDIEQQIDQINRELRRMVDSSSNS